MAEVELQPLALPKFSEENDARKLVRQCLAITSDAKRACGLDVQMFNFHKPMLSPDLRQA
jgi:hypothetical protein